MKRLVLVVVAVMVVLAVVLYLRPDLLDRMREVTGTQAQSTTVYKWQDKSGAWHVTDEPPPAGVPYQEQEYLHDTNILPHPGDKDD